MLSNHLFYQENRAGSVESIADNVSEASTSLSGVSSSKHQHHQNRATQKLKSERLKRKKVEQITRSLLLENEENKQTIADLQLHTEKLKTDNSELKDTIQKLKMNIENDGETISHLKAQKNTMKELLTSMESEHTTKLKTLKKQHKQQLDQLSQNFLKLVGGQPGNDVRTVIAEFKSNNRRLAEQVDMLAVTLARKERSLLEALDAVDEIVYVEEHKQQLRNSVSASSRNSNSPNMKKLQHVGRKLSQKMKSNSSSNSNSADAYTPAAAQNVKNMKNIYATGDQFGRAQTMNNSNSNGDAATNWAYPKQEQRYRTATFFKRAYSNEDLSAYFGSLDRQTHNNSNSNSNTQNVKQQLKK